MPDSDMPYKTRSGEPLRFDQEQYRMLMRCSEKEDMTEWNEWRKENRGGMILLEGAKLHRAHMEGADLSCAHMEGADISSADLKGAKLFFAFLKGANLSFCDLDNADFNDAHLEGADLYDAHLEEANLVGAHLEDVDFTNAEMKGTTLRMASVDDRTRMSGCTHDRRTNCTGVALRSVIMEPELRSALEGNNRRFMWNRWYGQHAKAHDEMRGRQRLLNWPLRALWFLVTIPMRALMWASDYGRSTLRIALLFFLTALIFAFIYNNAPDIVTGLHEVDGEPVCGSVLTARVIYFSVVTMTTLGFGDMYAAPQSIPGHALLTLQVLLGYLGLGAIITRLGILFQEG